MPEDKLILLKIEGELVDIMCEVKLEYKKNVHVENGVKVIIPKTSEIPIWMQLFLTLVV